MQALTVPNNLLELGVKAAVAIWENDRPHLFLAMNDMRRDNVSVYIETYNLWCQNNQHVALLSIQPTEVDWYLCTALCDVAMMVKDGMLYTHRACLEAMHSGGIGMYVDSRELKSVMDWIEDMESELLSANFDKYVISSQPTPEVKAKIGEQLSLIQVHAAETIVALKEVEKVEYPLEDGKTKTVYIRFTNDTLAITTLLNIVNQAGLNSQVLGMTRFNQALHKAGLHIDNGKEGHGKTAKGAEHGFGIYENPTTKKLYTCVTLKAISTIQQVWEDEGLMTKDGITYKMVAR